MVQVQQVCGQNQVTCGRHGQVFGQTLDKAQGCGLENTEFRLGIFPVFLPFGGLARLRGQTEQTACRDGQSCCDRVVVFQSWS